MGELRRLDNSICARIQTLLGQLSMAAEGGSTRYEPSTQGGEERIGPPGYVANGHSKTSAYGEACALLERVEKVLERRLHELKHGPLLPSNSDAMQVEDILHDLKRAQQLDDDELAFLCRRDTGVVRLAVSAARERRAA